MKINKEIFRSYDVRGTYPDQVSEPLMESIGKALAARAKHDIVVGHDVRQSSPRLSKALCKGITEAGKNVVFVKGVPLSAAVFWGCKEGMETAYVTASHLPKEWNGVKFFHPDGLGYMKDENMAIRDAVASASSAGAENSGSNTEMDVRDKYVSFLADKVRSGLSVAIDCGNGSAGIVARDVFSSAGCDVTVLNEKPDGTFPNRNPDPKEDPLEDLQETVKNRDIGIAYDGDGDRMFLMDELGRKLTPEQTSYLILTELLKTEKGPIVANVECTRVLDDIADRFNRTLIRVPVGHTFLMEAVSEKGACYGIESAGHCVVSKLTKFDDAIAASLYACHALEKTGKSLSDVFDKIPSYPFARINFECPDSKKFGVINSLKNILSEKYDKTNTIDGIRVDTGEGWALVRASNTSPKIRLTIEANDEKSFEYLKSEFSRILEEQTGTV